VRSKAQQAVTKRGAARGVQHEGNKQIVPVPDTATKSGDARGCAALRRKTFMRYDLGVMSARLFIRI